jgi:FkbH-like protein
MGNTVKRVGQKVLNNLLSSFNETPADYARVSRKVSQGEYLKNISIAFLSSYTAEILRPYIHVELAKSNFSSSMYFAPYNNIEQEIINNDSGLYASNPDIVVIHNRIEDISQNALTHFYSYSDNEIKNITLSIVLRYEEMIRILRKKSNAQIIIVDFAYTQNELPSFSGSSLSHSLSTYIQNINNKIWDLCNQITSCHVIKYQQMFIEYGLSDCIEHKLYFLARIPFSAKAQIEMGKVIARTIAAIYTTPCKCLVLDLDNTLWGGILGEDGVEGIKLGDDYPGNVYKSFQRTILSLRDQGVLLAIASKNNSSDALEVIEKHTGCLIKKKHLSSIQINWNDKATNLYEIARELNIGLNSIAFFDDNPVEREWITKQIPDVRVIQAPEDPMLYSKALLDSRLFDKVNLTSEDKSRAEMYKHEKRRSEFHVKSKSVDDFLRGLEMSVKIGLVENITLSRVEQLINKTNQYNLTCRRHTAKDIKNIISRGGIAIWISVKDKFGDSGIVGTAIAKKQSNDEWIIDTFLLSCRVIGRKLESVLLYYLCKLVKDKQGVILYGEYVPTSKNSLINDFFVKFNFKEITNQEDHWSCNLNETNIRPSSFIKVGFVE